MGTSNTVIYCFSGAGNSLRIARDLAERMRSTSVLPLVDYMNDVPAPNAERVGFVFPVIMMGIPGIVSRFLRQIPVQKDAYVFAVAANGGMMANALGQVASILRSRGMTLSAGFSVIPHRMADEPEARARLLDEIATAIQAKTAVSVARGSLKDRLVLTGIANRLARLVILGMDKGFRVSERCNGCGICSRICPVKNIDLVKGRPVWRHHCEQCLACLHWCPRSAPEYGKDTAKWLHRCLGMTLEEYIEGMPREPRVAVSKGV